jgi:hypothetical protein
MPTPDQVDASSSVRVPLSAWLIESHRAPPVLIVAGHKIGAHRSGHILVLYGLLATLVLWRRRPFGAQYLVFGYLIPTTMSPLYGNTLRF